MTIAWARDVSFPVHQLDNGVRVVVAKLPRVARAHIVVQLRGGPVHETDETWGMSHFLEHMVFRGTDRHRDVRALTLAADDFGGDIAAATYRDRVVFDTRCDPDRLADGFDLLASMLAGPRLSAMSTERSIIEEEIAEFFDDDGRDIDSENVLFSRMFRGHVLSRSIEGTPETLRSFGRAALRAFHARMYVGGNVVVSVAGPLAHRDVIASVTRAFGRLPAGPAPSVGIPRFARPVRSSTHVIRTDAPQTSVRLCVEMPGFRHADAPAAAVLGRVLDDGPASRLPARLVDRDGLAYSVWAMTDLYEEKGVLELGGSVRHERVSELVNGFVRELRELAAHPPTTRELHGVVRRYARDVRDALDDPAQLAESIGRGVLFHDPYRPAQALAALKRVTARQVQDLARRALGAPLLVMSGSPGRAATAASRRALARLVAAAEPSGSARVGHRRT